MTKKMENVIGKRKAPSKPKTPNRSKQTEVLEQIPEPSKRQRVQTERYTPPHESEDEEKANPGASGSDEDEIQQSSEPWFKKIKLDTKT